MKRDIILAGVGGQGSSPLRQSLGWQLFNRGST